MPVARTTPPVRSTQPHNTALQRTGATPSVFRRLALFPMFQILLSIHIFTAPVAELDPFGGKSSVRISHANVCGQSRCHDTPSFSSSSVSLYFSSHSHAAVTPRLYSAVAAEQVAGVNGCWRLSLFAGVSVGFIFLVSRGSACRSAS